MDLVLARAQVVMAQDSLAETGLNRAKGRVDAQIEALFRVVHAHTLAKSGKRRTATEADYARTPSSRTTASASTPTASACSSRRRPAAVCSVQASPPTLAGDSAPAAH
ncbi:hypothetical protein [Streptomyces sp. SCL15-6]|jgi:hypothetical protein|uniref:hypothetical protein n=1 Tax=Streptomyces sp. SCL15-6 TaxID=2967222 RepID=UPI00296700FA|nr:hypothetical protein [Streptomyces sp. SCL15-6]